MTSNTNLPFTTQAVVIDQFARLADPASDAVACSAILKVLDTRPDLRRRFFSQRPTSGWVKVLWDAGVFDSPPAPVTNKTGTFFPSWDAQDYLVAVAKDVPEFVRKHIQQLKGEAVYQRRAMQALAELPASECEPVMPVVLSWFTDLPRATILSWQAVPLIGRFIKAGRADLAIGLFEKVTQPWLRAEAATMSKWSRYMFGIELPSAVLRNKSERQIFYDLAKIAPFEVMASLQANIRRSIDLASGGAGDADVYLGYSRRSAIEDENEDDRHDVRDQLPDALLDALLLGLEQNQTTLGQLIERFLQDPLPIFRHIGLDFLSRRPADFPNLVALEIGKASNLYDDSIHYEFFALMASGYAFLSREAKADLISRIRSGPPVEQVERVAQFVPADAASDLETYKGAFVRRWIRDGLWNLRGSLEPADRTYLDGLVSREGPPEARLRRPSFTSSTWVKEGSPLTEDQMTQLEPPDLAAFLTAWKPNESGPFLPHHDTYRGLGNMLASVIDANPERYQSYFVGILLLHPEYAATVLNHFRDEKRAKPVPWALLVPGMEVLLASLPTEGQAMTDENSPWVEVRRAVARLCLYGVENESARIPRELLGSTKALLFELVNDADPNPELEEAWPNVDPLTASLNHVRPIALEGLIRLSHIQAQQIEEVDVSKSESGERVRKLDSDLAEALGKRLDTSVDRSLAVRSVIGRYLAWLQWLDPRWTQDNVDAIFPAPATPETAAQFLASFGGFVVANRCFPDLLRLLDSAYRSAATLVRNGTDPDKSQPGILTRLTQHVVWMRLYSDREAIVDLGNWMLNTLYEAPDARVPVDIAQAIVRAAHDETAIASTWPRIRLLVERRVNDSTLADHPSSYDEEMWELAQIFVQIKDLESIGTLSPLLRVVALHVARSDYLNGGWESLLEYVEAVIPEQPAEGMRLFQRMIESNENRHWYDYEKRTQRILERCGTSDKARPLVCAVIDLLESRGITEYHDLLERFCL